MRPSQNPPVAWSEAQRDAQKQDTPPNGVQIRSHHRQPGMALGIVEKKVIFGREQQQRFIGPCFSSLCPKWMDPNLALKGSHLFVRCVCTLLGVQDRKADSCSIFRSVRKNSLCTPTYIGTYSYYVLVE